MKLSSTIRRFILRGIAIVYLLLFLLACTSSAYFLKGVLELKPIPMIGILKYTLLCVLFLVLTANAIKAITLKPHRLYSLMESTKNMKWLFTIAILLALTIKLGILAIPAKQTPVITYEQLCTLLLLAAFSFWSNAYLQQEDSKPDSNQPAV